ncbi:MAG: hypothetical protein M1347_08390 [Chloroflexi bacterium]|nr:hypothetical protein [Chloroflexota bacterium]
MGNQITGEQLNKEWEVNAAHALYNHEGKWYHYLERFPGALFDSNGYILFQSKENYENNPWLRFGEDVHIEGDGISAIPGYVRMKPVVRLGIKTE